MNLHLTVIIKFKIMERERERVYVRKPETRYKKDANPNNSQYNREET